MAIRELELRQSDGAWTVDVTDGLGGRVDIGSIGRALEMIDVYDGIVFPTEETQDSLD